MNEHSERTKRGVGKKFPHAFGVTALDIFDVKGAIGAEPLWGAKPKAKRLGRWGMRYGGGLALFLFLFCSAFIWTQSFAQYPDTDVQAQEGRYVLVMLKGSGSNARGTVTSNTPAVVLDSVSGIVWRCQNLQTERAQWIKTDLAKNGDKPLSGKKYIIRMLEWPSSELKIPAVVLDIEEGRVWTCPNVLDESAPWVERNLAKDIKKEGNQP